MWFLRPIIAMHLVSDGSLGLPAAGGEKGDGGREGPIDQGQSLMGTGDTT